MNMRHAMFATVLSCLLASTAALAQTPGPTHIGVVNVGRVLKSMQETKDVQAKLEADNNSIKALKNENDASLQNMQQELVNGPKPDTQQYDDMLQKLEKASVDDDSELKLKQAALAHNYSKQIKAIFEKIQSAVADTAKQKQLDLVLTEMEPELAPGQQNSMTPEQLLNFLGQRNVLYAAANIDITDEVIAALDAQYKAGSK